MKYTKGPWIVRRFPSSPQVIRVTDSTPDIDGRFVGALIHSQSTTLEEKANASLIAASPDLLEALRLVDKTMHQDIDYELDFDIIDKDRVARIEHMQAVISTAIAKAESGQ